MNDHQQSGWALVRGAKSSWDHFRQASTALPPGTWRRWWTTIAIGFVATGLVMVATMQIGQYLAPRGMQAWDEQWLLRLEASFFTFHDAVWVQALGSSAFLLPVVTIATLIAVWTGRPVVAATIAAAYVLHDPIVWAAWQMWARPRPELILGGAASPGLNSYPSGHVVNVVTTFGIFVYLWMRASGSWIERIIAVLLLVVVVTVVGVARVRMGTHWPSDLIAGAVIGIAWLLTVSAALHRAEAASRG